VDSGVFSTDALPAQRLAGDQLVSVSVWTLGSFLLCLSGVMVGGLTEDRFSVRVDSGVFSTQFSNTTIALMPIPFQCPCGLWGLFYRRADGCGHGNRVEWFQCPCGLWGLFYKSETQNFHSRSDLFQCPCGLWGLFYWPPYISHVLVVVEAFQCPCGLWGLFYWAEYPPEVKALVAFQCPCGLWGLFYSLRGWRYYSQCRGRVSVSVWTLGSFLR